MDQPIMPIIVGVPRSGTTLLRMILDANQHLAIPPETGFLPALAGAAGGPSTPDGVVRLLTRSPAWVDFHLAADELRAGLHALAPFTIDEAARCFYRLYAARFGKGRWGDKTPSYLAHMQAIQRLLPEACFIHLIRDGRDVAASLRPMWFAPSRDIGALAALWRQQIHDGRRQAAQIERYVEVRYEDLVADTARVVTGLCETLALPWDAAMLRFYERSPARLDEHEERRGWFGRIWLTKAQRRQQQIMTTHPADPRRIGRWRAELSPDDQARFERVAGDLLTELGYA